MAEHFTRRDQAAWGTVSDISHFMVKDAPF
jgi:hypothetical protein